MNRLPNFGQDKKQNRPRGNRTWKTPEGDINIRSRFCQTVVPPSLHPSGQRYRFIQKGDLATVNSLDDVIKWLYNIAPDPKSLPLPKSDNAPHVSNKNSLVEAVVEFWKDPIKVFQEFGLVTEIALERNGEFRILGQGGLLVTEDRQSWYCFADEFGGGVFEAWGWCRMGSSYDKSKHFRQILQEMAKIARIDTEKFRITKSKCDGYTNSEPEPNKFTYPWSGQYRQMWERVR